MNKFMEGIFKRPVFFVVMVLSFCLLSFVENSVAVTLNSAFLFGGAFYDIGQSIKVDSSGNMYMVGSTYSNDLPTTPSSHRPSKGTNTSQDLYIVKFNSNNQIVYCTYFGGTGEETSYDLSLDSSGNVFVTGRTKSVDMPTTREVGSSAYLNSTFNPSDLYDAFIAEFNSTGGLVYSTYFGGIADDEGHNIAIDSQDNLYLTGSTFSADFAPSPTTGAYQSAKPSGTTLDSDMFLVKFNSSKVATYSSYLGAPDGDDIGKAIAVDSFGSIYIGGYTNSSLFTTKNAYKSTYSGSNDIILAQLDTNGAGAADLDYLTYMGGSGDDRILSLSLDSSAKVYATGISSSDSMDFQKGSYLSTYKGGPFDAFVAKFNPDTSGAGSLIYSAYLGGTGNDVGAGIAVDGSNNICITGNTSSTNFPTQNPLYSSYSGADDAFLTKFKDTGNVLSLDYSTYYGGTSQDLGSRVALDSSGNIYVAGQTASANFPTTEGAGLGTTSDKAFILKFSGVPTSEERLEFIGAFNSSVVTSGQSIKINFVTRNDVKAALVKFYAGEISKSDVIQMVISYFENTSTSLGLQSNSGTLGVRYGWHATFAGITQEGTYNITGEVTDVKGNIYRIPKGVITVKVMNATQPDILGTPLFYPNPFDPSKGSLKIGYTLVKSADITVYIFDSNGELVWKNNYPADNTGGDIGYNEVLWNGINNFGSMIGNGTYLIRIFESGSKRLLGKSNILIINGRSSIEKNKDHFLIVKNDLSSGKE